MAAQLMLGWTFCAILAMSLPAESALLATSSLTKDARVSLNERPVMKVVRLLQDTQAELQKELEDDKMTHEALSCWCASNGEEKKAAIATGTATAKQLEASIDEGKGNIAESLAKRKAAMDEKNADIASLQKAREMRMEQNKDFQESTVDLVEAIAACKGAITTLSKHHADFAQVQAIASKVLDAKYVRRLNDQQHASMLRSFMQSHGTSFLSIPGYQSYAPQSGQIFGILKQMQEDFEATLGEEKAAEAKAVSDFKAMMAAKKAEIKTGEELILSLDAKLAELGEDKAHDIKELEDTMEQLALDKEFLANLKEKCAADASEYDSRMKSRTEEIVAVQDTIKILNSPESFEAFDKMVITDFFQRSAASTEQQQRRQRAVAVLQRVASHTAVPNLALLAVSAQLDSFTKVKEEIDKMVVQLKKQQQDEVEFRDGCIDNLAENKRDTAKNDDQKESLIATIGELEKKIAANTKAIAELNAAVDKTRTEMERASETREAENAEFQQTVNDHRLMQVILQKAVGRMSEVYALLQLHAPPHIQTSATHTDPGNGPARFEKYEQNAGGKRVIAMLEKILAECKKTETTSIRDAQDSQGAYEKLMKDSNKSIIQMSKTIADLTQALAANKESHSSAKSDLKSTMDILEGLDATSKDLHASCDYVLNNFEARQAARTAEMDALAEAKAILSGSS